jgi:hypothetical protein
MISPSTTDVGAHSASGPAQHRKAWLGRAEQVVPLFWALLRKSATVRCQGGGRDGFWPAAEAVPTRNWREYDRALVARRPDSLDLARSALARGEGTGRRGRPQTFTDAAIQTVLTLKVLCQSPPRAAQGMAGGLIRLAGLDWRVPHDSTLSRCQRDLTVTIPYRPRADRCTWLSTARD